MSATHHDLSQAEAQLSCLWIPRFLQKESSILRPAFRRLVRTVQAVIERVVVGRINVRVAVEVDVIRRTLEVVPVDHHLVFVESFL